MDSKSQRSSLRHLDNRWVPGCKCPAIASWGNAPRSSWYSPSSSGALLGETLESSNAVDGSISEVSPTHLRNLGRHCRHHHHHHHHALLVQSPVGVECRESAAALRQTHRWIMIYRRKRDQTRLPRHLESGTFDRCLASATVATPLAPEGWQWPWTNRQSHDDAQQKVRLSRPGLCARLTVTTKMSVQVLPGCRRRCC